MSQLFCAPACICTCTAVVFSKMLCIDFFPLFEGPATLAWFSFSVFSNSKYCPSPEALCPLYVPVCFVSLAALFLLLCFFFFLTSAFMCTSPIKHFCTSWGDLRLGFEANWWQNKKLLWVTDAQKAIIWRLFQSGQGGSTGCRTTT